MKKNKNITLILFSMIGVLCLLFLCPNTVEAARKVTKVKCTIKNYGEAKEYGIIRGYDKRNKVVWKYKTKAYYHVDGDPIRYSNRSTKVYVFAGNTLTVLKKSNGKKTWSRKTGCYYNHKYAFDSKGNIYLTAYWGDPLVKISPKGKILWKTSKRSGLNYKVKYKNGKVYVWDEEHGRKIYSAKNGKLLK